MADGHTLTPWTTFAELTDDQRARFGGYVAAKDEVRARAAANRERSARNLAALKATGGDRQAAFALLMAGAA